MSSEAKRFGTDDQPNSLRKSCLTPQGEQIPFRKKGYSCGYSCIGRKRSSNYKFGRACYANIGQRSQPHRQRRTTACEKFLNEIIGANARVLPPELYNAVLPHLSEKVLRKMFLG